MLGKIELYGSIFSLSEPIRGIRIPRTILVHIDFLMNRIFDRGIENSRIEVFLFTTQISFEISFSHRPVEKPYIFRFFIEFFCGTVIS